MDYKSKSAKELIKVLDEATEHRRAGKISPGLYFTIVSQVGEVLLERMKNEEKKVTDAYDRAMSIV